MLDDFSLYIRWKRLKNKYNWYYISKQNKKIIINQRRKVYTDNELGYTCIEILNEDRIKQYFGIDNNIEVN